MMREIQQGITNWVELTTHDTEDELEELINIIQLIRVQMIHINNSIDSMYRNMSKTKPILVFKEGTTETIDITEEG